MSVSKSRPSFILPAPGSSEFAPALATGVLILLIALQLALPYATDLPPDSPLAARRIRTVAAAPLANYPKLGEDDLFDPSRGRGGSGAGPAADAPLQAKGVIASGRGAAVLMKGAGEAAKFVRAGEGFAGWRLVSIGKDAVWVLKGSERRRLAIGSAPAAESTPAPEAAATGDTAE